MVSHSSGWPPPRRLARLTRKTYEPCFLALGVMGPSKENMSRTAYGALHSPHGILRHREGGGDGRDSRSGDVAQRRFGDRGGTKPARGGARRRARERRGDR